MSAQSLKISVKSKSVSVSLSPGHADTRAALSDLGVPDREGPGSELSPDEPGHAPPPSHPPPHSTCSVKWRLLHGPSTLVASLKSETRSGERGGFTHSRHTHLRPPHFCPAARPGGGWGVRVGLGVHQWSLTSQSIDISPCSLGLWYFTGKFVCITALECTNFFT